MTTRTRKSAATAELSANQNGFSPISNDKLLQLYSTMLKCRLLEERISVLRRASGLSGPHPAAVSLEAGVVGIVIDLGCEDAISAPPQDVIAGFVKGMPLQTIFDRLHTRTGQAVGAMSASSHIGYPPLNVLPAPLRTTARLKFANGIALFNKMRKNSKIAIAFCGSERANLQSSWDAALNFAVANDLPIILVRQQDAAVEKESEIEHISSKTKTHSVPCIVVDGNDLVAAYRVASEAIAHARKGNGPTLIECCSAADDDSLLIMEKYLARKGLYSEAAKAKAIAAFNREMDEASRKSRKRALPQQN